MVVSLMTASPPRSGGYCFAATGLHVIWYCPLSYWPARACGGAVGWAYQSYRRPSVRVIRLVSSIAPCITKLKYFSVLHYSRSSARLLSTAYECSSTILRHMFVAEPPAKTVGVFFTPRPFPTKSDPATRRVEPESRVGMLRRPGGNASGSSFRPPSATRAQVKPLASASGKDHRRLRAPL